MNNTTAAQAMSGESDAKLERDLQSFVDKVHSPPDMYDFIRESPHIVSKEFCQQLLFNGYSVLKQAQQVEEPETKKEILILGRRLVYHAYLLQSCLDCVEMVKGLQGVDVFFSRLRSSEDYRKTILKQSDEAVARMLSKK